MPGRHRFLLGLLLLAVAALATAAPAAALDRYTLALRLARESARLGSASGAYVLDLTTGRELFARQPDQPLMPASNEKLFTTAAALLLVGPDGTLATSVRMAPGTSIDPAGVVHGDLYLVGGGDPGLGDFALRSLARALVRNRGIRAIGGGVIGDESLFDLLRGGPRTLFKADGDIGGQLGALTWGHGRADAWGPAHMAASRLQLFLKAEGVRMSRRARTGRLAAQLTPDETLASATSRPMRRLVKTTNQASDNFYAEVLLKGLGARYGAGGTTGSGAEVVRNQLLPFGLTPTIVDGSGLSRANRTTPRQVVGLLAAMQQQTFAATWRASLAAPGVPGTTLRRRMRGTAAVGRCRAKTGTLRGVSALSGYCLSRGGHDIAFSFIENGVCRACAKRVEDRMVPAIARYDG